MKQSRTRQRLLSFVAAAALALVGLAPTAALAEGTVAKIGETEYPTLEAAVAAAKSGETVTLVDDAAVSSRMFIADGQAITVDLAGHTVSLAANQFFGVKHGALTLSGNGTVKETSPNYGPVLVYGSADQDASNYSIVNVGSGVTLEGWAPVFIDNMKANNGEANGIVVNVGGKLNSVPDGSGDNGAGIYVNGAIKGTGSNAPVISLADSCVITTTGQGIYAAGYAKWNVNGARISGANGIEIRAGELNVNGGSITGNAKPTSSTPDGNGSTTEGAGIAIVQHTTKLPIKVTVSAGDVSGFTGIYEANVQGNDAASIAKVSLNITGGTVAAINGGARAVESQDCKNFVSGGSFSSAVADEYLADGFVCEKNSDGTYGVQETPKVAEVDGVKYETVNEAIAAANGKTVKLLDDVNEDVAVPAGVAVTLDLNGKTLTNVAGDTITNNGTLTITGEGTVDNVKHGKAAILNNGQLYLEGGTITRSAEPEGQTPSDSKGNSYYVVFNTSTGKMEVKDGATIKGISSFSSAVRNDGYMTVSGGLIQQDDFIAVKNDSGTLVVKGGTIKSANDQAIQNWKDATIEGGELDGDVTGFAWSDEASSTNITGGTINGNISAINYIYSGKPATAAPTIKISGDATVNGKLYAQKGTSANPAKNENVESGSDATVIVSGGTFSEPVPGDMAVEGYAPVQKIHKVTFVYGTGADDLVVEVVDGQAVTKPADPTYEGWNFEGWFLVKNADGTLDVDSEYDFSKPVTSDMTIYAGWTEVKPADDGNTTNPEQPKADDGKAEQKPAAATPKTGDATSNAPLAVAVVAGAGLLVAGVALGKRRER